MASHSSVRVYMRRVAAAVVLCGAIVGLLVLHPRITDAAPNGAAFGNNPPTNVACQGWERDTVIVSWVDNDNDEINYRIERSIDGGAFSEIATVAPNADGGYDAYRDTGVDVNKNYRYRVRGAHGDGTFTGYGPVCSKRRIFETSATPNRGYRIFYGLDATTDDCPPIDGNRVCLTNTNAGGNNIFVTLQQTALEGSASAFQRVGFDRDAAVPASGLDKIPVNVIWCDGGGCAGGSSLGLSPFLMETTFDLAARTGDPIAYLVGEHETFHFQQFKYGGLNDPADQWVIEGQARSSQDKICIGANRATALCFDDVTGGYAGYVPEVNGYLANTATPINRSAYAAALFWTYLTEKYGTSASGDSVEAGMNLMVEFWKASAANPNRDGIAVLNSTLQTLGTSMRFRDIWKDFAVANYAKNLAGAPVPAKYKYSDMAQPGGGYNAVTFTVNQPLALNVPFQRVGETVNPWAARYYRFTPAADVPVLDIRVNQDTNVPLYYTVLGIKNNGVAYEFNVEGRNLNQTVLNNAFSEVVIIVAGLENLANYRVSVNGTQPTLTILSPTTTNKARVGSNTAPEKFRVTVQLLAPDATPLTGVDLSSFNFRIGSTPVPADHILTSAKIQDQQWFILRAVTQTVAGQYDLHVNYANSTVLSATQTLAVNYAPRTDADSMLIIDRSGSMAGAKLTAAQNAARLYVDSWRVGDKVGVVSFNETPNLDMQLEDWSDTGANTRQQAFNAISGIVAGGGTNIGDSLMMGFNQLQTRGNAAHDWALVLLSDGVEQDSSPTVPFGTAVTNISTDPGKRPVIHAVAIGPNADGPTMQAAAMATGGTYQFVSEPTAAATASIMTTTDGDGEVMIASPTFIANPRLDLDARYRFIATEVIGQQQFFSFVGPLIDGNDILDQLTIPMEFSAAEMVLSLSFDGFCFCDITLRDSLGNLIPPAEISNRHYVWRAATPKSGNWTLLIVKKFEGPKAAAGSTNAPGEANVEQLPSYLVQSSVKSDVILDVDFPVPAHERLSGVPMPIVASLTDVAPITGASMSASIVTPNGSTSFLTLYDDGNHGDGVAADGVYANTFYRTGAAGSNAGAGSYNVTVTAAGSSGIAGSFVRQKILGFFIYSSGDDDKDGLPNEYELPRAGDTISLDPFGDPDNDNRTTYDEWQDGTDPFDADSDNGGESDGSEYNNGRDPLDGTDDDPLEPTWTVAYPGVSKVFVRYAPRGASTLVQIYRSESFSGTYSFLSEGPGDTGIVTDTAVMNGQTYCYVAIAIAFSGAQTAPLTPSCATPSDDPWPPDGGFLINGGELKTNSPDVTLTLFASDAVSPHTDEPGSLDDIMLPPPSSATSVTDMRIANRGDMAGASFEPFATTKAWDVQRAQGLATVYVQYRDAAGNLSRIIPNSITVEPRSGGGDDNGGKVYLPLLRKPN